MLKKIIFFLLAALLGFSVAYAEDMRAEHLELKARQDVLLQQADAEARQAELEASKTRRQIMTDKAALQKAVAALEADVRQLKKQVADAETELAGAQSQGESLQSEFAEASGTVSEIVGFIRNYARDLGELILQSPRSAIPQVVSDEGSGNASDDTAGKIFQELAEANRFPSMADVGRMVDRFLTEAETSGQVRLEKGTVVASNGDEVPAEILMLGNFTAAYRLFNKDGQPGDEIGYALYSENSQRFFALSKQPPFRVMRQLKRYLAGKTAAVYVDISKGGALRQLTRRLNLTSQIANGGPIVWPILLVFLLGVGIIIERIWSLRQRDCDAEAFMGRVNACVAGEDWTACRRLCEKDNVRAVPRVIRTALAFRDNPREDMENALQETILNEIPRLERGLSTLGMLAAIAPLLGLLGTVTGMINTFHMITYYGTGDARMMSGGISEALVTTMLGLCVAIPLMFAHTLLSRRVETIISQMEEKAVSFVNQVFKSREAA